MEKMNFEVGQKFSGVYPPEAAMWCNSNGAHIEETTTEGAEERTFEIVENQKPTEAQIADARIAELKRMLADTDYIVIKIAEGEATSEEYAEVLANRKEWRAEINALAMKY